MKNKNQCDGCRRGLPLDSNGIHRGRLVTDVQVCTADRYGGFIQPATDQRRPAMAEDAKGDEYEDQ